MAQPHEKVIVSRAGYPSIVLTITDLQRGNRHVTERFEAARDREKQAVIDRARGGAIRG